MSIRLKREYVEAMEKFWENSRMEKDIELINSQLETIENIFDWMDSTKKQLRDSKFGRIGLWLTLISISAVAAQIMSSIDYTNQLLPDIIVRSVIIFGSSIISTLILLLIYKSK